MSLTEVVFEVQRPEDPLSAYTSRVPASKVIYRPLAREGTRALLTATGSMEQTAELVRVLRDSGGLGTIEVASLAPYAIVVRILGGGSGPHPLDAAEAITDAFGRDTIVEPIVFESGQMRVRLIIPRRLDTRDVVTRLRGLAEGMQWKRFRVVRVTDFSPVELSLRLRRVLTQEQEELLRLAHAMGYYESPRRCTLEDIAKRLAMSVSPVHKKLKEMEHILIDLYLDPQKIPPKRRTHGGSRAPVLGRSAEAGPLREVTFTVARDEYTTVRFTRRHPGSQVIVHGLHENDGLGTYLMIVLAKPTAYEEFIQELQASARIKAVEVIARDSDHASLKVTTLFARKNKEWAAIHRGRNPLDALESRFGRDTFLKPMVVEGGTILVRAVITLKLPDDEVVGGFEDLLKETHWDEFEVLGLRDVSMEPTLVGTGQRGEITSRQEEVLRVAHALGYYKTPRECTLNDIAATLGVSTNAVHKNLTSAEQKILQNYLGVV